MAGDWIKIEHVTPDKPEIDVIAELTETNPDQVVGILIRLWIWADQQTLSGNAVSVTKKSIDRRAGVTNFSDAMIDAGWLVEVDGGMLFTNFERHNSKTAKQRALTSKRVNEHRAKKCNDDSVTYALPREEKRRDKEKRKKKKGEYTPEFEQFWNACPRKEGKANAWKAWDSAIELASKSRKKVEDETVAEFLTRMMEFYADAKSDCDVKYIRLPATWLNGGNWDDEIGPKVATEEMLRNYRP